MKAQTTAQNIFYLANKSLKQKIVITIILICTFDILFFGYLPGINVVIFLSALCIGITLANMNRINMKGLLIGGAVLFFCLLPIIEELTPLSLTFGIMGSIFFTLSASAQLSTIIFENIKNYFKLTFIGLTQIFVDSNLAYKLFGRAPNLPKGTNGIYIWVLPIVVSAIFLILFSAANPLIEDWLVNVENEVLLNVKKIDGTRIVLWALVGMIIWPFIRLKITHTPTKTKVTNDAWRPRKHLNKDISIYDKLINPASILRSLILFNIIFAMQSVLDIAYLWGGVSLPSNMTYC